ncbi:hypothetical protein GCM10007423_63360 [Dyadobacter endophyticus]|uniref:Uncharacterized protein n=1 Tax=Dyadobacter endophyticus TaxID=1749036 RepID=A0ABQ1ZDF6_9BACT|nr:hypothetical protein [Dyadobacter endophyticus]GGH55628.1 hypothetical protein GCM10007423_63360 [Dyadobacter endophyticus]
MKKQGLEETRRWEDLTESEQLVVTTVHTAGIEGNIPRLKEILDTVRPLIVIGKDWKYCRIHEESAPVVKLLIREYLQR